MGGVKREGFVFYRSFYEAINCLKKPVEKWAAMEAIILYALDGIESESSGVADMALAFVKPQIDANNRRYENGKRGGRKPKSEPSNNQTETKHEPNITTTEPKEKEKVKDKEKEKAVITNVITNAHTREEYGRRITQDQYKANLEAIRGRGKQ